MSTFPKYVPGKKYVLDGDVLNRLVETIQTNRLLPGTGYELDRSPGKGTRLMNLTASGVPMGRWDIVTAGADYPDQHKLRAPRAILSLLHLDGEVEVTNAPITLEAAKWIVARIDLTTYPVAITISLEDENEDGGLETYTFDEEDDPDEARLPLWHLTVEAEDEMSVYIGEDLFATQYCGDKILQIAYHAVPVPDRTITAWVPRLVSP